MSPTIVLTLIGVSVALVLGGVALLVPNLLKLPFALLGAGVKALIRPIKQLFGKGGKAEASSKAGVEEVAPVEPMVAAAV